jgi:hypothetical protein
MNRVDDIASQAAQLVTCYLRSRGICPRAALDNRLLSDSIVLWTRGELTNAEMDRICENILILNPTLTLEVAR